MPQSLCMMQHVFGHLHAAAGLPWDLEAHGSCCQAVFGHCATPWLGCSCEYQRDQCGRTGMLSRDICTLHHSSHVECQSADTTATTARTCEDLARPRPQEHCQVHFPTSTCTTHPPLRYPYPGSTSVKEHISISTAAATKVQRIIRHGSSST